MSIYLCPYRDENWLETASQAIQSGKIVALAYERLFGLAANALDETAVARVAAIKERTEQNAGKRPIAVVIPTATAIAEVAEDFPKAAMALAKQHWPGPLTLIVRPKQGLPTPLTSPKGLIGVRLAGPSPAALLSLKTGLPLTATSANRAGARDICSHLEIADLEGEIDLIIEGSVEGPPGSTVVDVSGKVPKVLRQGIITL